MREAAPLVTSLSDRLDALRGAALDELLATEAKIARCSRIGEGMRAAPAHSRVPPSYPVLLAGGERQRQRQLGWWARFQLAEGRAPAAARLLVAGMIVLAALSAGKFGAGGVSVFARDPVIMVYNGLGIPVRVNIDGRQQSLAAHAHMAFSVPLLGKHHVETRSGDGRLVEAFDALSAPLAHPVYNVASAAPLVEWTVAYGAADPVPKKMLGTPRWIDSKANLLFEQPPMGIPGKEGGHRSVLSGMDEFAPKTQLSMLADAAQARRLVLVHARWDSTATADAETWLGFTGQFPEFAAVLQERLRAAPLARANRPCARNSLPRRRRGLTTAMPPTSPCAARATMPASPAGWPRQGRAGRTTCGWRAGSPTTRCRPPITPGRYPRSNNLSLARRPWPTMPA